MAKKILIMTMNNIRKNYEVSRVMEEAMKMGVDIKWVKYSDMVIEANNFSPGVLIQGEKIEASNTYGIWFRVAGTKTGKYPIGRALMLRILKRQGVVGVNFSAYTSWERMGKIAQHGVFVENDIPVVSTRIFYKKNQVLDYEFKYPLICKHDRGFQGKSVRKFDNKEQMKKWLKKMDETKLGMFVWQDYLPLKWDLRVIVLGGKAIGAMRRLAKGEEFRSNFSLGGEVEKWDLSEKDRQIAEKVAKVCGLDYCGVDIMKDEKDSSYVLEVNRQCQFQGFEKSTGINVARKVVELLMGR